MSRTPLHVQSVDDSLTISFALLGSPVVAKGCVSRRIWRRTRRTKTLLASPANVYQHSLRLCLVIISYKKSWCVAVIEEVRWYARKQLFLSLIKGRRQKEGVHESHTCNMSFRVCHHESDSLIMFGKSLILLLSVRATAKRATEKDVFIRIIVSIFNNNNNNNN